MKRFLYIILCLAVLAGCDKSEPIIYRGTMFGTMQSTGVMLGDDGGTYHFRNVSELGTSFPSSGRIVVMFDVYSKLEDKEREYDAAVLQYAIPLTKDPVTCNTEEEDAALGDDPIEMSNGTCSAGYLNLLCTALIREASPVTHLVNLQIVPGENPDTLHTVLRHNAGDDKVTDDNMEFFSEQQFYASFPIGAYLPEEGTIVLEVKWFWQDDWHTVWTTVAK